MPFAFQVTLSDVTASVDAAIQAAIKANVEAALRYIGSFFTGQGTLDVLLKLDQLGADTLASAGSNSSIAIATPRPGETTYQPATTYELATGTDPNGPTPDATVNVNTLNLASFWFDPTPDDRSDVAPAGKTDFLTTMIHEFAHALGINGYRQIDGSFLDDARSIYDTFTTITSAGAFYDSEAVRAVAGGPVRIESAQDAASRWYHIADPSDTMYYRANDTAPRGYTLTDLAILHDSGMVSNAPGAGADVWFGSSGNDTVDGGAGDDRLYGLAGDDRITGGPGNNVIDGGSGFDTAVYLDKRAADTLTRNADGSVTVVTGTGTDQVRNVEVFAFADKNLFAVTGTDATVARLYAAAFARAPDPGGLNVQLGALHGGVATKQLAANFIDSAEFVARYGASSSDNDFVKLLYNNVLNRDPDAGGYSVQIAAIAQIGRAQMLLNFADSSENVTKVGADWLIV